MNRSSGSVGGFCWLVLSTGDPAGASEFYGRLFGWRVLPAPVGSIFVDASGAPVGTVLWREDNKFARKEPVNWFPFIRVSDVDATAERVTRAGGRVWGSPYGAGNSRLVLVRGATGERFGLWQTPVGAGQPLLMGRDVCSWFELATREPERAKHFYETVFGWRIAEEGGYTFIGNETGQFGGIVKLEGDWEDHAFLSAIGRARGEKLDVPPHWMVFFATEDCDDAVDEAEAIGALITQRPEPLHTVGTFAVVRDPQDAYFALLSKR
jgi:uncharacterized protein